MKIERAALKDIVDELKSYPLPRATPKNISFKRTGCDPEWEAEYVAHFLPARIGDDGRLKCVGCACDLDGFLTGRFVFGLRHGDGHCGFCGYPCRALHYPKRKDGTEIGRCTVVLQYHPDEIVMEG